MNGWRSFIKDVGFPIFVAMVLLGMLVGVIPSPITRAETKLQEHMEATRGIRPLLRMICQNGAPNDWVRAQCAREGE